MPDGIGLAGISRSHQEEYVMLKSKLLVSGMASALVALVPLIASAFDFIPQGEGTLPSGNLVQTYQFTLYPGEMVPWHYHPGPVYVVVVSGWITEDEGCGRQLQYIDAGSAFNETPGAVHQVFNYGNTPIVLEVTLFDIPPAYASYNSNIFVSGPNCEGQSERSHLEQ